MSVKSVTVKTLPYQVRIKKEQHDRAQAWCRNEWGQRWSVLDNRQGTWCCFWAGFRDGGGYRYHFVNEQDAILFSLRWS